MEERHSPLGAPRSDVGGVLCRREVGVEGRQWICDWSFGAKVKGPGTWKRWEKGYQSG